MERSVTYGYVERAHGLKGRMILKLFVLGPAVPLEPDTVLDAGGKTLTVTRSRKRDNERITIDCKEVWTQAQAVALRGETITADLSDVLREDFPLPVHGFAGFTILSGDKSFTVQEVQYNSTNPQLKVSGEGKSFTVPLNMALTGDVNAEDRTISVELPEGLEEL